MVKLKIISVESKPGATGSFVRANTDQGWLSAFEEPTKGLILQSIGKELECEIVEKQSGDKTYRNIVSAKLCDPATINDIPPKEYDEGSKKSNDKFTTMYVSYAKDVFVALDEENGAAENPRNNNDVMIEAIKLVKQARDAFS